MLQLATNQLRGIRNSVLKHKWGTFQALITQIHNGTHGEDTKGPQNLAYFQT